MTTDDDKQQVVTDLAVAATDRALRAAAATIGQMSEAELQCKFSQLKRAHASRTPREILRQQTELDSLEIDQMAYELASQAHAAGNLVKAARLYRVAAMNDFADAPFKLAMTLDSLASKCLARPDMREERGLVTEAANWYLAAFLAGDPEALDRLDSLIARLDGQAGTSLAAGTDDPCTRTCVLGGLQNVVELQPAEATAHCSSCGPCQAELIKLRPLMGVLRDHPGMETADTHRATPDGNGGPQRSPSDSRSALHPGPSSPGQGHSRPGHHSTAARKG